jgi:hypothetical protein
MIIFLQRVGLKLSKLFILYLLRVYGTETPLKSKLLYFDNHLLILKKKSLGYKLTEIRKSVQATSNNNLSINTFFCLRKYQILKKKNSINIMFLF